MNATTFFFSPQKDLTVTCMGIALQQVIPMMVGKKLTAFFELVKPLIEFKFDLIVTRSVFFCSSLV